MNRGKDTDVHDKHGTRELLSKAAADDVAQKELEDELVFKREWDDRPLRWKIGFVIFVSLFTGMLIGMGEQWLSRDGWVMALGFIFTSYIIYLTAQRWVCDPIEKLSKQITSDSKRENLRPFTVSEERQDEVGKLSRAFYHMSVRSLQERFENNQLRRTLDDRVLKATRRATVHLQAIAMKDPLTGLGNRRSLDGNLDIFFESCIESEEELVIVCVDLDHFKTINDEHGHAVGDRVLCLMSDLLMANVRSDDLAARQGGDEFVVLMPGCSLAVARELAKRISQYFDQQVKMLIDGQVLPTLSIGIASSKFDLVDDGYQLLEKADNYLYEAKRSGKGCVVDASVLGKAG